VVKSVVVFRTYNDMESALIRCFLENENIFCQLISSISHSVFPFTHDHSLSEVRIAVNELEAHRAEEIINDYLRRPELLFNDGSESGDNDQRK